MDDNNQAYYDSLARGYPGSGGGSPPASPNGSGGGGSFIPNGAAGLPGRYEKKPQQESDPRVEKSQQRIEADPSGRDLKEPGTKADDGKVSVVRGCLHYFPRAITAIAELSCIGAEKYSWKGWESVPDGINRYGDAMGRHELRIEDDYSRRDPDTCVLEATAVAWNAVARLELVLREHEKKGTAGIIVKGNFPKYLPGSYSEWDGKK